MKSELSDAILGMREDEAVALARRAVDAGTSPAEVLEWARAAMTELGRRFECGEAFIPELIMGGEMMRGIAGELQADLATTAKPEKRARVVVGTVAGDIHDIGKDIVKTMLELAGHDVVDLGVDVAPARFVEEARSAPTDIVALSGLLTIAFDAMKATTDAISEAGLRPAVEVIIGGAPVDDVVCRYVGADAWGKDAGAAVRLVGQWAGGG